MDSAHTSETPEVRLHFLDYWRVIRLRKSLILTVFFLCVITSTVLCLVLKPQFASTVQIEVQKDTPIVPLAGEVRQMSIQVERSREKLSRCRTEREANLSLIHI